MFTGGLPYWLAPVHYPTNQAVHKYIYRCADKSLAQPGMKQATVKEDFDFHISYL